MFVLRQIPWLRGDSSYHFYPCLGWGVCDSAWNGFVELHPSAGLRLIAIGRTDHTSQFLGEALDGEGGTSVKTAVTNVFLGDLGEFVLPQLFLGIDDLWKPLFCRQRVLGYCSHFDSKPMTSGMEIVDGCCIASNHWTSMMESVVSKTNHVHKSSSSPNTVPNYWLTVEAPCASEL